MKRVSSVSAKRETGAGVQMRPTDFERFVAGLFERDGYEVSHRGGTGDQGCDLKMQKDGAVYVVQCKQYGSHRPIGPNHIREFETVIRRHKARHGWFVTTSDFTSGAREATPGGDKMSLINRAALDTMILRVMGPRPMNTTPAAIAAGVKASLMGDTPIEAPPTRKPGRYTFAPVPKSRVDCVGQPGAVRHRVLGLHDCGCAFWSIAPPRSSGRAAYGWVV